MKSSKQPKQESKTQQKPKKIKCLRTNKGIIFGIRDLNPWIKRLKTRLTFTKKQQAGRRTFYKKAYFYKIYEMSKTSLFAIAEAAYYTDYNNIRTKLLPPHTIVDKISKGITIPEDHFLDATGEGPGIELYPNQSAVHDYLIENHLNPNAHDKGNSGFIFVMDTGLGKSFVASKLIETTRAKTLLVVMNTSQVEQWKNDVFGKFYPHLKVGEFHGKSKRDGDVVIAVINSVGKIPTTQMKTFKMIIWDEIPEYMGQSRRQNLWSTSFYYQIGLTATPDERLDGFDIVYKQHIGPLVKAKDIPGFAVEDITWKANVTAVRYQGPPKYTQILTSRTGEMNSSMMNSQFSQDPYRTKLILNHASRLFEDEKQVYIFAQKREHLESLEKQIRDAGIDIDIITAKDEDTSLSATKVQTLMGGASEQDVINAKTSSRIILTTYQYGSVGLSIVRMDAIIFATPRRNKMRQILGRILRRGSDPNIVRDIVDIIDDATRVKNQYNDRKRVYKEKKFEINEVEVKWDEL